MKRKTLRKVVIPIAGLGTRMFPATKLLPKALFPCLNPKNDHLTPVIMMIIEHAVEGLTVPLSEISIGIIISPAQRKIVESFFFDEIPKSYYGKDFIKDEVDRFVEISKRVTLIEQPLPNGFGDAIRCARDFVAGEHFVVMIGDHLFTNPSDVKENCVGQLVKCYNDPKYEKFESFTSMTICKSSILDTQGVMIGDYLGERKFHISNIVEKPPLEIAKKSFFFDQKIAKSFLGLQKLDDVQEDFYLSFFGIEIFSPKIFDAVDLAKEKKILHKGEVNMRDSQRLLIQNLKDPMLGVMIHGRRLDVGLPKLYLTSLRQFYEN